MNILKSFLLIFIFLANAILSFLHALLCYFSYKSQNGFKIEEFQNAMIGTFFVLYLVALCVLAFAYKNQGLIHLIYLGLL